MYLSNYSITCKNGNITFLQLDHTKRLISRICSSDSFHNRPYYTSHNVAHIEYRSGTRSSSDPASGFSFNFTQTDINECVEEQMKCLHICTNTPGSYVCSCRPGYVLSADGHTCFGEIQPQANYIMINNCIRFFNHK